jgi:hypothetical protein
VRWKQQWELLVGWMEGWEMGRFNLEYLEDDYHVQYQVRGSQEIFFCIWSDCVPHGVMTLIEFIFCLSCGPFWYHYDNKPS